MPTCEEDDADVVATVPFTFTGSRVSTGGTMMIWPPSPCVTRNPTRVSTTARIKRIVFALSLMNCTLSAP